MANVFENIAKPVGGVLKGAGDIAGGALQHIGTGLKGVRDAERAKLKREQLINDIEKIRAAGGMETEAGRKMLSELSGKYKPDMFKPDVGSPAGPAWLDPAVQQQYGITHEQVKGGLERQMKGGPLVNIQMPKAAPTSERAKLTDLISFRKKLGRIGQSYSSDYVGPIQGRAKSEIEKWTGTGITKQGIEFRQLTKELADDLLRLKSGAQINEQEYQRLMSFLPTHNLPAKTFVTRYNSLVKSIDDLITTKQNALTESGLIAPTGRGGPSSPQSPYGNLTDEELDVRIRELESR